MADYDVYILTQDGGKSNDEAHVPGASSNQHSLPTMFFGEAKETKVPAAKLEKSWKNVNRLLGKIIQDSEKEEQKGFILDEMEVALSVSGKGNIAFVTATANASIKLKFKRR